jgi:ADP-dependent NAD(P)H-hydrate dehydratase / NAD(P)H-hydrate epimerase
VRLVGSAEMRSIDRAAIDGLGVPSLGLMERAGRAVAEAVVRLARPGSRFLVVCGGGNNAGDGWVAARLLQPSGRVRVVAVTAPAQLSGDAAAMARRALEAGVPFQPFAEGTPLDAGPDDLVVDALLGTGLARPADGRFAAAIAAIALARRGGARVVSVDLPSGLSADTGRPIGPCVEADATVTFGLQKRGLVLLPGAILAGTVTVADIGLPPAALDQVEERCRVLEDAEARSLLPPRDAAAHKGDAGRLLVLAGSPGKTGAAHLALLGALRGGAGLVTLASRAEVLPFALAGRPEAMSLALPGAGPLGPADLPGLLAASRSADALVAGPGLHRGEETGPLLRGWLAAAGRPAVLDADALNALDPEPAWLGKLPAPVILTPHPGELARLCGLTVSEVQADRIGLAASRAASWGAVLVLKGARTVVAAPGRPAAVIPTGNAGLATGGTGDVLAGLCGALLAGGLGAFDAARVAAWVHGAAGDLVATRLGQRGLLAGDLGEAIGRVWARWGR